MSMLRYGGDPAERLLLWQWLATYSWIYKAMDSVNPPVTVLEALKIWKEVAG